MSKNKVRLLLIEDYVELNKISMCINEIKASIGHDLEKKEIFELAALTHYLLNIYEKVFFRFGLMDVSYLVLKKELKNVKNKKNIFSITDVENLAFKVKILMNTLSLKLKKLSLNEVELKYIMQKLPI